MASPLKIYWKTLFIMIYPLLLLSIFIKDNGKEMRCLYVVLLMAGFWVFEVIPTAITALFPLVFFPLFGILDTKTVSRSYFKDSNMMFVGGLMIALAIEYCNLHTRVSLNAIKLIGCSYRRLSFGLNTLTMLVSMWISNTAAAAMMLPIIKSVLEELESQNLGKMWEDVEETDEEVEVDPATRKPTRVAMCFFLSTAYAATIGGLGCLVGSGTNLAQKGIYETLFPNSPGIEFNRWMASNAPLMIAIMYPTWIWLQFWFMGLWRPNSKDAKAINVGKEGEVVARRVLTEKLEEMGPLSAHQVMVAIMFVFVVMLWFLRRPGFMEGWPSLFTDTPVSDATCAMIVVILLFILPARLDFIYMFSKDETKRPTGPSPALITWRYINQKMHWSLIFLMGGGFALADGIKSSNLGLLVAEHLKEVTNMPKLNILVIACLMTSVITQITSNVAIGNILLPIVGSIAVKSEIHPLYLMMPVGLNCSFAFCLPVSTPPNAIVSAPCNMRTIEMIKAASVVQLIAFVMLIAIFPNLGPIVWPDMHEFPDWARIYTENSTNSTA